MKFLPTWVEPPQSDAITAPGGRRLYVLTRPFWIAIGLHVVRIPDGFIWNDASSPRALHWVIGPADCGEVGPLVHDALYQHGGELPEAWFRGFWGATKYSRLESDGIFREIMLEEGIEERTARWAWLGVRLGGWKAFKSR